MKMNRLKSILCRLLKRDRHDKEVCKVVDLSGDIDYFTLLSIRTLFKG